MPWAWVALPGVWVQGQQNCLYAGARTCLWNLQACLIVATVTLSQNQALLMEARRTILGSPQNPSYHLAKALLWLRAFDWATTPLKDGAFKVYTGPPAWQIASILLFSLGNVFNTAPSTGLFVILKFWYYKTLEEKNQPTQLHIEKSPDRIHEESALSDVENIKRYMTRNFWVFANLFWLVCHLRSFFASQ